MTHILIHYDRPSNTFIAQDQLGNAAHFQNAPDGIDRPFVEGISRSLRPMQALLLGLGTCSGIDIVSILDKQRESFDSFEIQIHAMREENVVPALWQTAHVTFLFTGKLSVEKAQRAADLSVQKYCSVAETLRRAGCHITHEIKIN